MLRQRDHNAVLPNDACLLARDFGQGIAEILLMIERDIGDDGDHRFDDIGGVEPPTHAHFQHRDLDRNTGEIFEGHHRQHLEEAGVPGQLASTHQVLRSALDAIVHFAELRVGDGLAVNANPLVDANQVRRTVERGPVSGDAQDRGKHRSGRAFAVGSRNQHAGETPLGMAEGVQHLAHIGQVELVRRRAGELVPQRVELLHGALVSHAGGFRLQHSGGRRR